MQNALKVLKISLLPRNIFLSAIMIIKSFVKMMAALISPTVLTVT